MKRILIAIFMFLTVAAWATPLQLETIGATGGSNLFLTYMAIGVTADAYQNKTYEKDKATSYVNSMVAQARVVQKYLKRLIDEGELSENDVTFVKRMVKTYDLLIAEGEAFIKYAKSGDQSHADTFHKNRKAAWKNISDLLGIK